LSFYVRLRVIFSYFMTADFVLDWIRLQNSNRPLGSRAEPLTFT
jgi:hypothetical protein